MSKKHGKSNLTRTTPVGKPVAEQEVNDVLEAVQEVDVPAPEKVEEEPEAPKAPAQTLEERVQLDRMAALATPNALEEIKEKKTKVKKPLSPEDQAVADALEAVKVAREKAKAAKVEKKRLEDEAKANGVNTVKEEKIKKNRLYIMALAMLQNPDLDAKAVVDLADANYVATNPGKSLNHKEMHQEYLRAKIVFDTLEELKDPTFWEVDKAE